jgi:hypothetical protein
MLKLKICFCFLILLCVRTSLEAQEPKVAGVKLPLPEGNVIGAAFDEQHETIIVQQSKLSSDDGGLKIRSRRQLSIWSVKNRSQLQARLFDLSSPNSSAFPCGRVQVSTTLGRILLCSASTSIEVLSRDDLTSLTEIGKRSDQIIRDFAIDDARSRVLVLSSRADGSVWVSAFSMNNAESHQETQIPSANAEAKAIAISAATGQIAVALTDLSSSTGAAVIYFCDYDSRLACGTPIKTGPISQMVFLGRQLLFVTSSYADRKKDCIMSASPVDRSIARAYCSPATGVHYAFGALGNKFVAGFTGVGGRNWLSQENKSVSSSFSVWAAENPRTIATAKDPTDYGAFQNELRIAGSDSGQMFAAYQRVSNILCLYSVVDPN